MKLSREPALALIGLLAPAVQLVCAFLIRDGDLQGSINAVASLVAGVLVSVVVKSEKLAPTIMGLAQALLALALQIGFVLDATQQASIMAFVGVAVAAFVRTQVYAPNPDAVPVGEILEREGRHEL